MTYSPDRRQFLRNSLSGAALLGMGNLGLFPAVSAAETRLDPDALRMGTGIDPLVQLIEETPRDRLLEEMGSRVRKGLAYKQAVAALLLAAVRNVQPRPVGFKFHAVLALNSAHQASMSAPDADRWLPIFWALDNFKGAQAEEKTKTGWQLPTQWVAVDPPDVDKAAKDLVAGFEKWDPEAVDRPAALLATYGAPQEVFEIFFRHGARDFRDIGHKVIYVAGAYRLLQTLGWQYAPWVLRSLALALQYYTGENPAQGDHPADRPWRRNVELCKSIRPQWRSGKKNTVGVQRILSAARQATDEEMSKLVVELLNAESSPDSVWEALFVASGEILMRRAGILSLHALTTMNALHYCFNASASDETRRLLLLQAAAFVPLFRGKIDKELKIDEIEPAKAATVEEIFADVAKDNLSASRKLLGYLNAKGDPKAFIDAAQALIFIKGRDSHDYKFSSAVLEDYPVGGSLLMVASVHHLKGSNSPDSGLVQRIRASLK